MNRAVNKHSQEPTEQEPQKSNDTSSLVALLKKELQEKRFTLPVFPESAQKVRKAVSHPNVTATMVSKLISSDPVMSGRLLQVANSPIFKGLTKVSDLNTAVSRLGLDCVQNLVVSLSMNSLYKSTPKLWLKQKFDLLWRMNTEIAVISQVLAGRYKTLDPSQALLAGLLHNIGTIPILLVYEKNFGEPTDYTDLDLALLELAPDLSQWILENWRLSEDISLVPTQAVDFYREDADAVTYSDIVQVALLHVFRGQNHPFAHIDWLNVPVFKKLALTPEDSIEVIQMAQTEIKEMTSLLQK